MRFRHAYGTANAKWHCHNTVSLVINIHLLNMVLKHSHLLRRDLDGFYIIEYQYIILFNPIYLINKYEQMME